MPTIRACLRTLRWIRFLPAAAAPVAAWSQTPPAKPPSQPADAAGVSAAMRQQLLSAQRQLLPRTPAEAKLDSGLLLAARGPVVTQAGGAPLRAYAALPGGKPSTGGELVVIKGDITPALHDFIVSQGGTDIAEIPEYHSMSVRLPLSSLAAVTARPEVRSIALARPPAVNQATPAPGQGANWDGDAAHEGALLRGTFKADGTGIKVCVISDSIDHLAESQQNGTLGAVEVLAEPAGVPTPHGHGEGTAMLEIVHRIAPGATLAFADMGDTRVRMAINVARLALDHCTIIVDDITYSDETPFQDGEIARAARAATDNGILFFSSAANSGNLAQHTSGTWEGDFSPSTSTIQLPSFDPATNQITNVTYRFHQFAPGVVFDNVTQANPGAPNAQLTWNDPVRDSPDTINDYLFAAFDEAGQLQTLASSVDDVPMISVDLRPHYRLAVLKAETDAARVVRIVTNRGRLAYATDGQTFGHNALGAAKAFTIAAVTAQQRTAPFRSNGYDRGAPTLDVESFSSDGPRRVYYDGAGQPLASGSLTYAGGTILRKPDFAAADCVVNSVQDPAFQPMFCGTSAAAPQAAAIAALILSAAPKADVKKAFADSSLLLKDMSGPSGLGAATWTDSQGLGLINPVVALRSALDDQGIAIESFTEIAPLGGVSDSSGHRCGLTAASGGAVPTLNGATPGWTLPPNASVSIVCKNLPADAVRIEALLGFEYSSPTANAVWRVHTVARNAATGAEVRTNNWTGSWGPGYNHNPGVGRVWSENIPELPAGTRIDYQFDISNAGNLRTLLLRRFRIGPLAAF